MLLILLDIIIIILCKIFIKKINNKEIIKYLKLTIRLVVITTILELTLFNFRAIESLNYQEIKLDNYVLGPGLKQNDDGTITLLKKEDNYIEFKHINKHIDNIHIDIKGKSSNNNITVGFGFTDSANKYYSYLKNQVLATDKINNGDTFRAHFRGNTKRLKIYIEPRNINYSFTIREISINKKIPYKLTLIRPLIIIIACLVLYLFRPSSYIYKIDLFDKRSKKFILATACITVIFMGVCSQLNPYFTRRKLPSFRYQYHYLTEALANGHTYLDIEPGDTLKVISNPYDTKAREHKLEEAHEKYLWDTAFYNNKYYVYFGVAPVICYFLPFYLLTGKHISITLCVVITTLLTIVGIFLLLWILCKKWFKNIKLGHYLIITLTFIFGCGLMYIVGRPDHYNLPIIMAIMFSIYGIICWLKALDGKRQALYLFIGSTLLAGVAASRPQLLLTSFFVFPIFFKEVFKKRTLFSKSSIKETLAIVLPYIIIAGLLMTYNYVRFSNPFDFGANYNLTTNDMTQRGFVLDRIPLGIFYYLFNPMEIIPMFPFVTRTIVQTDYVGRTIAERMGAGFLIVNFISLVCVYLFKRKDEFKDKMPYHIAVLSIIFSLIIIVADTEMAGILPRYVADFGFLMYIATSITLFHILNKKNKNELLTKILFISFIVVITYNTLFMFSDSNLYNTAPFNYVRHLISFWQ